MTHIEIYLHSWCFWYSYPVSIFCCYTVLGNAHIVADHLSSRNWRFPFMESLLFELTQFSLKTRPENAASKDHNLRHASFVGIEVGWRPQPIYAQRTYVLMPGVGYITWDSRKGVLGADRKHNAFVPKIMHLKCRKSTTHEDVIIWRHFPLYWSFVRRIHRWPVNSPHKGQWRGALMFSLICARINGWVNNREAGDLRTHHAHYDVTVIKSKTKIWYILHSGLTYPTSAPARFHPTHM